MPQEKQEHTDARRLEKEEIEAVITELGKPLTIRGEALTLEEFASLSELVGKRIEDKH